MTKESESQGWIEPEELLTTNKEINPESAKRNTVKLLKGLSELGLHLTDPAEITIVNIPPLREIKSKTDYAQLRMEIHRSTIDIPNPATGALRGELIRDSTEEILIKSNYSIAADVLFDNQPFELYMLTQPEGVMPYYLNLTMRTVLRSNKEMALGSLPSNFTSVGFAYNLTQNPQYRNRLSSIAQKRIPAEIGDNDSSRESFVDGIETQEGLDTVVRLYLQDPNPKDCLKCYEVEVRTKGERGFSPNTPNVAPESIWQEKENHYCMVEGNSYPLSPITLDKISKLRMDISYRGESPKVMFDLLGDLPLSIDWINQWYASESDRSKNDYMQLLFKPEWGENNAAFVYHKSSKERILPEDIHNALKQMNTVKNSLTEKLAA